jgi:hypothetical protein
MVWRGGLQRVFAQNSIVCEGGKVALTSADILIFRAHMLNSNNRHGQIPRY